MAFFHRRRLLFDTRMNQEERVWGDLHPEAAVCIGSAVGGVEGGRAGIDPGVGMNNFWNPNVRVGLLSGRRGESQSAPELLICVAFPPSPQEASYSAAPSAAARESAYFFLVASTAVIISHRVSLFPLDTCLGFGYYHAPFLLLVTGMCLARACCFSAPLLRCLFFSFSASAWPRVSVRRGC